MAHIDAGKTTTTERVLYYTGKSHKIAGKNPKIPWPINHLGAFFLSQPFVRKGLCKQAFADPTNSVGPAEEQNL